MGKIEILDFDGDFESLSAMARDAWLEEYGVHSWPDLYRPALAAHFCADVPDPRFLIAAYDGGRIVAFVANLPRTYRLNGRSYMGVSSCMLVTRGGYRGAAVYMISECLRRNHDFGADFAVMTIERKHRSSRMFDKYLRPGQRLAVLKTMYPLLRAVDFERIVASEDLRRHEVAAIKLIGAHRRIIQPAVSGIVRPYDDGDLPGVLALQGQLSDDNNLVRVFREKPLARQLKNDDVTATVVYKRDSIVRGFINFSMRDMVSSRGRDRWAWLDFLQWEGCSYQEKRALLAGLWQTCRDRGCIGILEWSKGYYSNWPLFGARFVPYPRFLDVNAWLLSPDLSLQGIAGMYEQVI